MPAPQRVAARQREEPSVAVRRQSGGGSRHDRLGAELFRLPRGLRRQVGAADAPEEAEVVADLRTGSGLTTQGETLDDDGPETLGGRVHRRCQPGRTGADDRDVVLLAPWSGVGPERIRQGHLVEIVEHPAVPQHGCRKSPVGERSGDELHPLG